MRNKYRQFSAVPFVKEHLRQQIEAGGGKVYQHFEDIPKTKYKQCKLIAPHPSATAKYVQCLAVDIAVSANLLSFPICLKSHQNRNCRPFHTNGSSSVARR